MVSPSTPLRVSVIGRRRLRWYYFATTKRMKWCESWFEMRVLRQLDHDPEVVAVAVQPFVLHYRDVDGRASHTPTAIDRFGL